MLGGIRIPKVPPAVIVPAASFTSYFDRFIVFAAIIPSIVTEAPTIPGAAAKIVETNNINNAGSRGIVVGDLDNNGYPDILKWRYYFDTDYSHIALLNI